jgi:SepF-like predicted cell division protein (DUF552 family)
MTGAEKIKALAKDKAYVRKSAIEEAAKLLKASEDDIYEALMADDIAELDESDPEDHELIEAYEELSTAIAKEVVHIGNELEGTLMGRGDRMPDQPEAPLGSLRQEAQERR